jgi:serine/threonine-protein kinase HipA
VTEDGQQVQFILDDLIARTPGVVVAVRAKLPADFPEQVADSILSGLQDAANRLTGQD